MTDDQARQHLTQAHRVALEAQARGAHPFGAILVAPDGVTVLAEQGNLDAVNHAESTLARRAAATWDRAYLEGCTLVTTFEPCAMCTATIYWAAIGTIVYGVAERDLLAQTGNSPENPTLDLPCREVLARGQRPIAVRGPFADLSETLLAPHRGFWTPGPPSPRPETGR